MSNVHYTYINILGAMVQFLTCDYISFICAFIYK